MIRRERTRPAGRCIFTGRDAAGDLLDAVFDEIERQFTPHEPAAVQRLPPAHRR